MVEPVVVPVVEPAVEPAALSAASPAGPGCYSSALKAEQPDRARQTYAVKPGHIILPASAEDMARVLANLSDIKETALLQEYEWAGSLRRAWQEQDRLQRIRDGEVFYPDELGLEYETWDVEDSDEEGEWRGEYNDWVQERKR